MDVGREPATDRGSVGGGASPSRYHPGNPMLPAALGLLQIAAEHWRYDAYVVERASADGRDGDSLTVDWAAFDRPGLPIAMSRIAALARSLLDGTPADLSLLVYLSPSAGKKVVEALRLIWERDT